ncbi:hypothetical protein N7931_13530 [Catenovulum sp. 2E275]|uniref:hypothetical protein n=1 Tax=Catenovulum sp. 2E275 TaxID=2980497 RepID=UPI0021D32B17|nr:hypothetical protein [Catenovulum sp. 2E275]MCU4676653.1 hypothetical protein [Catenovulum sp. 2E275]
MLSRLNAVILVILSLLSANVFSAETDPQIQNQLNAFALNDGHGTFIQQKKFKLLTRAIESNGEYWIDNQQQQIIWQTNQPVFNRLVITADAVKEQNKPDSELKLLTQQPAFTQLLYSVFSGRLTDYPGIVWQSETDHCIQAKMDNTQLAQFVSQIQLCKLSSNNTQIRFFDNSQTETLIKLIADK